MDLTLQVPKTTDKQLNEVEIGNLLEKELRTKAVKMITDLRKQWRNAKNDFFMFLSIARSNIAWELGMSGP